MNSFNHYSLGSVGEWLFSDVAGIGLDADVSGISGRAVIHPNPGPGLNWGAGHPTIRFMAPYASEWEREGDTFRLTRDSSGECPLPLYGFPPMSGLKITESGEIAAEAPGCALTRICRWIRPGTRSNRETYRFESTLTQ